MGLLACFGAVITLHLTILYSTIWAVIAASTKGYVYSPGWRRKELMKIWAKPALHLGFLVPVPGAVGVFPDAVQDYGGIVTTAQFHWNGGRVGEQHIDAILAG